MSENLVQYVEAAGRGDTDAMAKLYSKTLKASYFLAAKLSESESEAVEITKKAYARAFCSIDKLKKPEAFEIWLKQMISTIYKDSAKFVFGDADGSAQESTDDFLPEAILTDDRAAAKVMEAVAKLTPERRTALLLHYYMGMPVNALAKYFGVSESTATAILSNAKADINSKSGVKAPEYPELASLPVLTRLFQKLVAKTGIDNTAVRDMFIFAIEAYLAAKPQTLEEPVRKDVDRKEETPEAETAENADEAKQDSGEDEAEKTEEEAEEKAEDSEEVAEEENTEEETEESAEEPAKTEEEQQEEKEDAADDAKAIENGKAEIEDNLASFKDRINSMLGVAPVEEKAEEAAEASEEETTEPDGSEVVSDFSDEPTVAFPNPKTQIQPEIPEAEEDTFEKIKRSIDGLAEITEGDASAETQDEGAVAFADYTGSEKFVKDEPEAIKPADKVKKSLGKITKKPLNVNPKIIIAAVVILVAIVVAVVLIAKGGKKDAEETTTVPVTAGQSNETVTWNALPELAAFEEIEYLNENFNSFKDPESGKYGLINYKGEIVLEAEYDGFRHCSNGRYYGNGSLEDSGYHIVALDGDDEYEVALLGASATVSNKKHADHATNNDTTMDGTDYDERDRYYEGYAAVRKDGKWGYASSGGKIVVPYEFEAVNDIPSDDPAAAYDYCRGSVNGYVAVKKDGKMGIIKIEKDSYAVVADFKYDVICQGKGGVFLAYNGKEWGNIVIGSASGNSGADESEATTLAPVTGPAEPSIDKYVVNTDQTNIRSAPDTEADNVIATLEEGYEINALEKKKGNTGSDWIRFDYNGQEAWISAKKLDKAD